VEDLLGEDNFMEECKSHANSNPQLMAFLTSKRNFVRLLDYIIKMPTEEDTHERKHKYPFMINELFSQDGIYLLNPFFEEEQEEEEIESSPEKEPVEEEDEEKTEATADSEVEPVEAAEPVEKSAEEVA